MACSSQNTLTGRGGRVSVDGALVLRVTQWTVNPTLATTSEWGDSDSGGYTNRTIGRRDATFTAEGKYASDAWAYDMFNLGEEGDAGTIAVVLWMNGTADPSTSWYFPCCICTDFSLTVDVDTEEVIGWTASFGPDGIFYSPGVGESRPVPS